MPRRWTWVLPLVLSTASASARSYRPPREPAVPVHDFWRDVIEPHSYEIARLLELARRSLRIVDDALVSGTGWAAEQRQQYVVDAYHLMKHARTLSPLHLEVLALLGRAADEAGRTAEAIEAYEAHARLAGRTKASAEVVARLGGLYLRLGETERGIAWLRLSQGAPNTTERGRDQALATIYLAHALADRGDPAEAIDVLIAAAPPTTGYYYYGSSSAILSFALAVIYDRIEQRGAAFDQLHTLQATLAQTSPRMYLSHLQDELARIAFTAPEDVHYYRALLYESLARYVEARAEWAHYAAVPDASARARALAHIAAIDARKRAPVAEAPAAAQTMFLGAPVSPSPPPPPGTP